MATVLRSSLRKTICRARFLEENISIHPFHQGWRLLHAGRTTRLSGSSPSRAKPVLKSPKVDPLVKKIDDMARRAALVEYTQSLVQEKTKILSPNSLGIARPWLLAGYCIGLYIAGYHVGFYRTLEEEEYQESGRTKEHQESGRTN